MSDTAKDKLAAIVAGLDGVTPGKWCQLHPSYCAAAVGAPFSEWDSSHDLSAVVDGKRRRVATFKHADDAAHMDRCSPDTMRSIADAFAALETEVEALRAALEPFAERADRYNDIPGILRINDGVEIWQIRENKGLEVDITVGHLRRARTVLSARGDGE